MAPVSFFFFLSFFNYSRNHLNILVHSDDISVSIILSHFTDEIFSKILCFIQG